MNSWHYRPAWVQLGIRQNLVGAEIGVAKGTNAFYMLSNLNIEKLYLIDPYFDQSEEFDGDERPYLEGTEHPIAEETARRILDNKFKDKMEWLIGTTEQTIDNIPDESLDFCYVDGSHEYEFVKQDIRLCLPKLKFGGVLGGHDFVRDHPGVIKAVLEEFKRERVFVANIDWWVIK